MSWIKENMFLAGLIGGTLVGVILLYFVGAQGSKKYAEAQETFNAAVSEAKGYERGPLYPTPANHDGKKKALGDFRKATADLQASFEPYRPGALNNVSPQEFTDYLKKVTAEVRAAFDEAGTTVPEEFFSGFETYKAKLAPRDATGIMIFQLKGIRKILLDLAKAKPTQLTNVHRPALPEESGGKYKPGAGDVARRLPLEITFQGPEEAARKFQNAIVSLDEQFVVIRNMRIRSSRQTPPRSSDVKFESPVVSSPAESEADADNPFGAFADFGDDEEAEEEPAAPEPAAPVVTNDSSRILAQVLGGEEVQVFVRLDLMLFLPEKKLH